MYRILNTFAKVCVGCEFACRSAYLPYSRPSNLNGEQKLHSIGWKHFVVLLAICVFCNAVPLVAQEPALTDIQEAMDIQEAIPDPKGINWERVCIDMDDPTTCRIVQNLFLNKTVDGKSQTVGRILQVNVLYATEADTGNRTAHLSMNLPLGVDLRPGAVIRIDEDDEIPLPYLQCLADGCAISTVIDEELLQKMKLGNQLFVGFRPWGTTEITIVPASLIGFSRAFTSIK